MALLLDNAVKQPQVKAFLEWVFNEVFEGQGFEDWEIQDKAEEQCAIP